MSTERNKNTIKKFFDAFVNGRNQEMHAFLTNDAQWWINGKTNLNSGLVRADHYRVRQGSNAFGL